MPAPIIRFAFVHALVCLLAAGGAAGQPSGAGAEECAFEALETARQFLSDSSEEEPAILGIIGFFGQPQPPQWLVLVEGEKGSRRLREFVVSGGEIRAERQFRPVPGQDVPDVPIQKERLKIDALAAFATAERLALRQKVSFESTHFQLRCRDDGDEPVWMLSLVGPAQVAIGAVYLSAESGEVLRAVWVDAATERLSSTGN